uniref:Putative splicing factor 3B subunit n=1 Tax=Triatoma infestans TaxID=30076 RepID=A0A170VEF8_TRIIF
MVFQKKIPAR